MARRNAAEILTGAAVLVLAAGFLAYGVAHSGRGGISGGYTLYAKFDHIDGLQDGADVRMAGVKVGTVTSEQIDPKNYIAVLAIKLRDDLKLPKDSSAEITSEGLLGGKYLSLSPGGDTTMLQPGQSITITQSSVSLEQLLGKFIFSVTDMVNAVKASQPGQSSSQSPAGGTPAGEHPTDGPAGAPK
jgi:phospholipid/cholesterol/gamma-HCH transport system substrate-binding protein